MGAHVKKVKCILVQALRLCTSRTARRSSCIALLILDHRTRVRGQRHALAALYPRERPGTHCTGGWVGPSAGLDWCGKSRLHRDSIPGPSSPVAQSLYRLSYPGPLWGPHSLLFAGYPWLVFHLLTFRRLLSTIVDVPHR
jgi:hypothetical protein